MAAGALLVFAVGTEAQGFPSPERVVATPRVAVADALVAEGRRLHAGFEPEAALERFRSAARADSLHYEALWLAAAEGVAVGIIRNDPSSGALYQASVEYAERAVAVEPDGSEAHEWLAVALGRHALSLGVRDRVLYAEEILRIATRAIELDPESSVGHHVVGQWHAEVRRLNGFERFIAERLLGGQTFGSASLEVALFHLGRAVELNPLESSHRFELGRVYIDLGRPEDARTALLAVIEAPDVAPTDGVYKARAREELTRLEGDHR